MKYDYDAIVVGAGPGGSMTAKSLAQKGVATLLVEKRPEIGMPVRCGEATGTKGMKELGIPLSEKFVAKKTRGVVLYSPSGTKVEMLDEEDTGVILERRLFDKYLAIYAAKAGAEVRTNAYVIGLIKEGGFVKGVKLLQNGEKQELRCKVVVGADGIEGKVGRWAGIDTRVKLVEMTSNVQVELAGVELDYPDALEFYFGSEVAPLGYAWVFPKGEDAANVGLGIRRVNATASSYLKKFVESKPNLKKGSPVAMVVGGVPVQGMIEKSCANGVVLVGDSARQVDPLTGGGIYNAMKCGLLASEVIAEAIARNDFSEKMLSSYDRRWREALGPILTRSLRVKNILERLSDQNFDDVAKAMRGLKFGGVDIKDVTTIINQMPPELVEFVQSLL